MHVFLYKMVSKMQLLFKNFETIFKNHAKKTVYKQEKSRYNKAKF